MFLTYRFFSSTSRYPPLTARQLSREQNLCRLLSMSLSVCLCRTFSPLLFRNLFFFQSEYLPLPSASLSLGHSLRFGILFLSLNHISHPLSVCPPLSSLLTLSRTFSPFWYSFSFSQSYLHPLSVCPPVRPSVRLCVCLSVCLFPSFSRLEFDVRVQDPPRMQHDNKIIFTHLELLSPTIPPSSSFVLSASR